MRRNRLRPKCVHACRVPCGRKAGYCPDRKQVRPDIGPTKSRAGRGAVGLPDPLIVLLKVHDTLRSRSNLAYAYQAQAAGHMKEASAPYERTLADRQRLLGDTTPTL